MEISGEGLALLTKRNYHLYGSPELEEFEQWYHRHEFPFTAEAIPCCLDFPAMSHEIDQEVVKLSYHFNEPKCFVLATYGITPEDIIKENKGKILDEMRHRLEMYTYYLEGYRRFKRK
jgi:hypothetical protein